MKIPIKNLISPSLDLLMPLCGRRVGDAKKPKTVGGADGSDVGKIVARWSSLSICFQISNVLLPPPISLQRRRTPPATPKMTRAKGNTFLAALSLSYGFSKAACLFPSLISCGPVDPFSQVSLSLRSFMPLFVSKHKPVMAMAAALSLTHWANVTSTSCLPRLA